MGQFADCRQCKQTKVGVANGRLLAHRNAQNNPCTGSHAVVPPSRVKTDDLIDNLVGGDATSSAGHTPRPDLGMTVMGPLNSEGPGSGPYPGTEPDKGWLSDRNPDDPQKEAPVYSQTTVRFTGDGDEIGLEILVEGENEPRFVDSATAAGVCKERNSANTRICLRPRGSHEHQFSTNFASRERVVTPEETKVEVDPPFEIVETFALVASSPAAANDGIEQAVANGPRQRQYADCSPECGPDVHTQAPGCVLYEQAQEDRRLEERRAEPTKQREGDQILPGVFVTGEDIQTLVIVDINRRREVGIERYGSALLPFNGRSTLVDLYEELIDAVTYTRSMLRMQEAARPLLVEAVAAALVGVGIQGDETESGEEIAAEIAVRTILDTFTSWGFAPTKIADTDAE